MTTDFVNMMHLLSCSAQGTFPDLDRQYNIENILCCASNQSVSSLIYPAIKKLQDSGVIMINHDDYKRLCDSYVKLVFENERKNHAVKRTLKYLEDNDIDVLVIKGIVLATLYDVPESRISGDTDILLCNADQEDDVISLLSVKNFKVMERASYSHHFLCKSTATGLIEIHTKLYDEIFDDIWFEKKVTFNEEFRTVTTYTGDVYKTLGITDGAIFVVLHMVKHFVSGGVGIRQILDVLMYNNKYRDEIDWERYNQLMCTLKFDKLIQCIYSIGKRYFDMTTDDVDPYNDICDLILSDIENSGAFGFDDNDRKNFYRYSTYNRHAPENRAKYEKYINNLYNRPRLLNRIFPKYEVMSELYPKVTKFKGLIILYWLVRIVNILMYKFKRLKPKAEKERLKILEKLDMI